MQYNREPLWTSGYNNRTTTYSLIQTLNQLRNHMVGTSDWAKQPTQLLATSPYVDLCTPVYGTLTSSQARHCHRQGLCGVDPDKHWVSGMPPAFLYVPQILTCPQPQSVSMGTYTPFAVATATTEYVSCSLRCLV
jgi:hypothetical protein